MVNRIEHAITVSKHKFRLFVRVLSFLWVSFYFWQSKYREKTVPTND